MTSKFVKLEESSIEEITNITTIDVFKSIMTSEGEFNLFPNSQKGGEKKNG